MSGPLRILVTGSRKLRSWDLVRTALLDALATYSTIGAPILVHGGQMSRDRSTGECYGADYLADQAWRDLARERPGWLQQPEVHPAQWFAPCRATCEPGHRRPARHAHTGGSTCPAQGNYRNTEMVDLDATVCLAFPLDGSVGTWDCVGKARAAGIPVKIVCSPSPGEPDVHGR